MSGLCKMCDGTNTVIVDYDRQVYAPCAACHPSDVYARIAALEGENARLTGEVRGLVARVHATDHDVIDGEWTDCPFDACTNARAALARPGGGMEG